MEISKIIERTSKDEQKIALKSYRALTSAIRQLKSDKAEIEIEETEEKIVISVRVLKLLSEILMATSQGKPISIVPIAMEVTTQRAAEILGCSRPHLVKLLENGKISFSKVGKHRRVRFEDLMTYRHKMKQDQKKRMIEIMKSDEESGLYDS